MTTVSHIALYLLAAVGLQHVLGIPPIVEWFGPIRKKFAVLEITSLGTQQYPPKIQAIKEIRSVTGLGLKESKEVSEGFLLSLHRRDGDDLLRRLRALGVETTLTATRRQLPASTRRAVLASPKETHV